ncbi:MAG: hypothetical protein ACOX5K_00685 [Bacteroidales bacterium]
MAISAEAVAHHAATTAMYAAESLGLGTRMIGVVHPLVQYGKKARKFREKHGTRYAGRKELFVIFGYPAVKQRKEIKRTFDPISKMD